MGDMPLFYSFQQIMVFISVAIRQINPIVGVDLSKLIQTLMISKLTPFQDKVCINYFFSKLS